MVWLYVVFGKMWKLKRYFVKKFNLGFRSFIVGNFWSWVIFVRKVVLLLGFIGIEILKRKFVWFSWCFYGCRRCWSRKRVLKESCWRSGYVEKGSVMFVVLSNEFGMNLWFKC